MRCVLLIHYKRATLYSNKRNISIAQSLLITHHWTKLHAFPLLFHTIQLFRSHIKIEPCVFFVFNCRSIMESKAVFKKSMRAQIVYKTQKARTWQIVIALPHHPFVRIHYYLIVPILYMTFGIIILFYYYYTARAFILLPWQRMSAMRMVACVCVCKYNYMHEQVTPLKSQRSTNCNTYDWDISDLLGWIAILLQLSISCSWKHSQNLYTISTCKWFEACEIIFQLFFSFV